MILDRNCYFGVGRVRYAALALAFVVSSAGLATADDAMDEAGAIPQPGDMSIDPVRDGTVVVLARDGRYLEASFGGTPWTDIYPRSPYLLSTCVDDRVLEAPIIRRIVDISGCDVRLRSRPLIAASAIPTVIVTGHGFIFGPVAQPSMPSFPSASVPVVHPPVLAARVPALNARPAAIANASFRFLSTSATGSAGTVLMAGGNGYTFHWDSGNIAIGRAPPPVQGTILAPPVVAKAGPAIPAIVPPHAVMPAPLHRVGSVVAHVTTLPLPPVTGTISGHAIVAPPLPKVPHVQAAVRPPGVDVVLPKTPGIVIPRSTPVAGPAFHWVAPVPGAPPLVSSIVKPSLSALLPSLPRINPGVPSVVAHVTTPSPLPITGTISGHTIVAPPLPKVPHVQAAVRPPGVDVVLPKTPGIVIPRSTPVAGPAFHWVAPVSGAPPLVSSIVKPSLSALLPSLPRINPGVPSFVAHVATPPLPPIPGAAPGHRNVLSVPVAPDIALAPSALGHHAIVPRTIAAIAVPATVDPNIVIPRIPGSVAAPTVFGGLPFYAVNVAVHWVDPAPGVPPRFFGAGFAAPTVASPLYLAPVAYASVLPKGNIAGANSVNDVQLPVRYGTTAWNAATPAARIRAGAHWRGVGGAPPGYSTHGIYASSFHPGLTAPLAGAPTIFGQRR